MRNVSTPEYASTMKARCLTLLGRETHQSGPSVLNPLRGKHLCKLVRGLQGLIGLLVLGRSFCCILGLE